MGSLCAVPLDTLGPPHGACAGISAVTASIIHILSRIRQAGLFMRLDVAGYTEPLFDQIKCISASATVSWVSSMICPLSPDQTTGLMKHRVYYVEVLMKDTESYEQQQSHTCPYSHPFEGCCVEGTATSSAVSYWFILKSKN